MRLQSTNQVSLRVGAFWAENKLFDKPIQQILKFLICVGAINDVAIIFCVKLGLSTQLTSEKFGRICKKKKTTKNKNSWTIEDTADAKYFEGLCTNANLPAQRLGAVKTLHQNIYSEDEKFA